MKGVVGFSSRHLHLHLGQMFAVFGHFLSLSIQCFHSGFMDENVLIEASDPVIFSLSPHSTCPLQPPGRFWSFPAEIWRHQGVNCWVISENLLWAKAVSDNDVLFQWGNWVLFHHSLSATNSSFIPTEPPAKNKRILFVLQLCDAARCLTAPWKLFHRFKAAG